MNPTKNKIAGLSVLLVALSLFAVGCGTTKPGRAVAWNVSITKTTPASIEVDLIGVTENEKQFYAGLAMEDYWKSGGQVRKDADKLTKILQKDQAWIVDRTDPKWDEWLKRRGKTELLIIANLPVKSGLWKLALPLDKKSWLAKNTLEIEVLDTRIVVVTPQKPRK